MKKFGQLGNYRGPLKLRFKLWKNREIARLRTWWPLVYKKNYQKLVQHREAEQRGRLEAERKLRDLGTPLDKWILAFSQIYLKRERGGQELYITTSIDDRLLYALAMQREKTEAIRFFTYEMASVLASKIQDIPPRLEDGWNPVSGMMLDHRKDLWR